MRSHYRFTHKTFKEYCCDRFGHSRQKLHYLIAAANVFENSTTNKTQILPSNRINRLRDNRSFEEAAYAVLKDLGEFKRAYLNKFEEEILSFIEKISDYRLNQETT
ncbi:hypothetical protein PQG02_36955 (plasmid) [Nostoc sp. UHCC 0926]|uniref:hypothetical protein n=1 Tax=Nostoc sp. UHCC 0926 TaxID=3025190 RepID=UPI00235F3F57|nr:hypothetical protein [Nostoc sp. UHCC 0926]WDD36691.1 hypothetical protein PQG02_36955 [Nostoc sp. UHCC 0926]